MSICVFISDKEASILVNTYCNVVVYEDIHYENDTYRDCASFLTFGAFWYKLNDNLYIEELPSSGKCKIVTKKELNKYKKKNNLNKFTVL